VDKIQRFCDKNHFERFLEEQKELTEKVIKAHDFARAKVPLRFNGNHPHHPGTTYLPCVIAQIIDGDPNGKHKMYLLVVYIETFGARLQIETTEVPIVAGARNDA
jgi:hypothetical protein